MKILYVDSAISGHHIAYMSAFLTDNSIDALIAVPKTDVYTNKAQKNYFIERFNGFESYLKWIFKILDIAKKEEPDIVHFVYGDDLYRYFGVGLEFFACPVVVTFHQVRHSRLRDISFKRISKNVNNIVVHTSKIKQDLESLAIKNVVHIEYPNFNSPETIDSSKAKEMLNIPANVPVVLALGGTRSDKGVDLLLDALNNVTNPFHLLIAGKEEDIKEDTIRKKIVNYRNSVTMFLEFLSNEKMNYCLNASDIIVLPYRKTFDGASGPLVEGVTLGKVVLGSNHGSLGSIIEENHIGYTFESEDISDLSRVLDIALSQKFICDDDYEKYKKSLSVDNFLKKYNDLYRMGYM